MTPRIVLAEDHLVVRQSLKVLLESEEKWSVVGQADDGREAVRLVRQTQPDIAVLDLAMPLLNGLDAAREIRRESPNTRTLLLTMHKEDAYVLEALQAGVHGYVVKTQAAADLVCAIRDILGGKIYLSPSVSRTIVEAYLNKAIPCQNVLSSRERQVLQLIAEGKTSKAIADILSISARTAESHRARIMRKLNVHDTAGLVRYAVRSGLVEP